MRNFLTIAPLLFLLHYCCIVELAQSFRKHRLLQMLFSPFARYFRKYLTAGCDSPPLDFHGNPFPRQMHISLLGPSLKARVIIVGDIHGCFDELNDLLVKCKYSQEDSTVVLVGDLVNKGPKSANVVKFARESGYFCVRGNHDEWALARARKQLANPPYLSDLSTEDLDWLQELPYTITIPSLKAIVVHAGLVPHKPLEDQRPVDMVTMRNLIQDKGGEKGGEGGESSWVATSTGEGEAWAPRWDGDLHVYFGHDAKRHLQLCDKATGLDTGAAYGRQLTAIILPEGRLVQVDARAMYEEPGGKKKA